MKNKTKLVIILAMAITLIFTLLVNAEEDLVASLAKIPGMADTPEKGAFVELVKAIDEVYPGSIKIELYPYSRSIDNVINGKADFHLPNIRSGEYDVDNIPYKLVEKPIGAVSMVLYSHVDNKLTQEKVEAAQQSDEEFPYEIENFFSMSMGTPEQALLKVKNKRIDGYFNAQEEVDMALRELKIKEIYRELFMVFEDVFTVQKSTRGDEVAAILTECLNKLEASGKLQEIYYQIHKPYEDWQPADMDW